MDYNTRRKIRYNYHRDRGLSAKEARALRDRSDYDDEIFKTVSTPSTVPTGKVTTGRRYTAPDRNEIRKIRYHILREAGYSSAEANRMKSRAIEIGNLRLDRDGSVPTDTEVFQDLSEGYRTGRRAEEHRDYLYTLENDSLYSNWGLYTKDDRYKDDTARIVKMIQDRHDLSIDQAYYFYYTMVHYNKSYEEVKRELLSNKEFEMYDELKKRRKNDKFKRRRKR